MFIVVVIEEEKRRGCSESSEWWGACTCWTIGCTFFPPSFETNLDHSCRSVVDGAATALWQISLPLYGWDPRAPRRLDVYHLSPLFKHSEIMMTSPMPERVVVLKTAVAAIR